MKKYFLLLLIISGFSTAFSQSEGLPKGFAPGEEALMPWYLGSRATATSGITTPPPGPVRTAAEWEEVQALFISWKAYSSVLTEIVRYAREECLVVISCPDSNVVKATLNAASVSLSNVEFLQYNSSSVWIRDYGGNPVYMNGVDSLMLVDWIYNRVRPADDVLPDQLATYFNVPLYATTTPPYDLVNTGGNFMCDGNGTAFASKLVLQENDGSGSQLPSYPNHTEVEIDSIMYKFMGIDRYIKMETLPYDGIHHIDMHMKLLDEETLLVGEYPSGVSDGTQIEANLQYVLSNFNSMFGTPYKVIRVAQPPDGGGDYPWTNGDYRTYANAVFINKTVLVPTYAPQYDTTALRIWRESLPGYRIVGINCNSTITASGAIHCITHSLGVLDPLLITHQPIVDNSNAGTPFTVEATIRHRSGIASADLYYSTDTTQPYMMVAMANTIGDTWSADIPGQSMGTQVFYYIHATATSGKEQVRPLPAPEGYWEFWISIPASIKEITKGELRMDLVFPNPAAAITCIPVFSSQNMDAKIYLMDVMGRVTSEIFSGVLRQGDSKYFFDASKLSAGAYLVVLETPVGKQTQRVIVR